MWTEAVSGKKKLRIQKYPDTCWRGLRCAVKVVVIRARWWRYYAKRFLICDDFEFVENRRLDGKRATKKTRQAYDYWSNRLGDIERGSTCNLKKRMIIVIMF